MKNVLVERAFHVLGGGIVLLIMFLLDLVPYKLRNAPEIVRLGIPIFLIIIGVYAVYLRNKKQSEDK